MEPASTIIPALGGPSKVASFLGIHRTRVSNWTRSKQKGGTGGRIPLGHHRKLIQLAADLGKPLTADDLLPLDEDAESPAETAQAAE